MKRRKKDDFELDSKAHLSGILYTTRRSTITEKDFPPKKKKSQKGFFGRTVAWMQNVCRSIQKKFQRKRVPRTAKHTPRRFFETLKQKLGIQGRFFERGSKPFYIGVASTGLAAIVCAIVLTSGILEPAAVEVTVNDAGRVVSAMTSEATVGEFFDKNGIEIQDGDVLEVSESTPIEEGMEIVIRRAMPLTIIHGNEKTQVRMLAGTVEEALSRANIQVDPEDEVYPVRDSYVSAGMSINVIEVETKTITEQETLYYKELTKNDSSLAKGKTKLQTAGKNGVQENTIEITYKNGVEISRKTVSEKVISEPVDQVTLVGTYEAPKATPKPSTSKPSSTKKPSTSGDSKPSYSTDDDGKLTSVPSVNEIHSGTLYEHKNVPAPASSIIKKTLVINRMTAYTHTGNRTATGTWPKIGTVAADPKQIPYGTKLYIPGYGYGRVEDTGSNKHDAGTYCLDLFMETKQECMNWGVKRNVKIYILK